jgi:hypothetical protein
MKVSLQITSVFISGLLLFAACSSQATDDQIKKWPNNEKGLETLTKFVADPKNPVERRVVALEALSDAGLNEKLRSILDGCKDADKIAGGFAKSMMEQLKSSEFQKALTARDNLFIILGFLPQNEQGWVRKTVSEWAFGELKEDSSSDAVKETIEKKILTSQIEELGEYGVKAAMLLVKNGFKIEKMSDFILAQKDVSQHLQLLEAFKKLHAMPLPDGKRVAIEYMHITKIAEIKHPLAAAYLLDIASDKDLQKDTRSWAFNKVDELLELKEVKADPKELIPMLRKFLISKNPDDRWDAALNLLKLEGYGIARQVIDAFADDGTYSTASEDPMKSVIDFCKDGLLPLKDRGDVMGDIKKMLLSKNRIQKAIAVVCYKVAADKNAIPLLKPLLSQKKVKLDDFLGEEKMTLASLTQNAIEGIAFLDAVEQEIKSGKLSKEDGELKKFAFTVELVKTGEEYKNEAQKRFESDLKEKSEKK